MENELSEPLRKFIKQHITSLEQLEILLLLCQESDHSWTVEQVFKVMRSNLVSVAARLKGLATSGFLTVEDNAATTFRFSPKTPELARRVEELKNAYTLSRIKIIETIFSSPSNMSAQHFADSFKLKNKE